MRKKVNVTTLKEKKAFFSLKKTGDQSATTLVLTKQFFLPQQLWPLILENCLFFVADGGSK
jgi:hypothetical protein